MTIRVEWDGLELQQSYQWGSPNQDTCYFGSPDDSLETWAYA
jgi:hypothetical protein